MKTRIKICGITSVTDALASVEAGADYLGLIFVPESPRSVPTDRAREIVRAVNGRASVVGVFRNRPIEAVNACAAELGLDLVQLHGNETPDDCRRAARPVVKALEISETLTAETVRDYAAVVTHLLFDRSKKGAPDDWLERAFEFLSGLDDLPPYFFAGGLAPETVERVVSELSPFGVDVASGVENSPGIKDIRKIHEFCQAVKPTASAFLNS